VELIAIMGLGSFLYVAFLLFKGVDAVVRSVWVNGSDGEAAPPPPTSKPRNPPPRPEDRLG